MVLTSLTLKKICINKTHQKNPPFACGDLLMVEGLVDTRASMFIIMDVAVVRELGIMHLVIGSETYKTTLGVVTQAMGRIDEVPIKV
jgi:hypothetical protein